MDKRAQIADTMTWVVATLVIVAVLGISIAISSLSPIISSKIVYVPDKQKDLLATKSITSFLRNSENVASISSENKEKASAKANLILQTLPKYSTIYAGQRFGDLTNSPSLRGIVRWLFDFESGNPNLDMESSHSSGNTKIKFWAECYNAGC